MKTVLISQKDLKETTSGVPRKVHQEIKLFRTLGWKVYTISESIDEKALRSSGATPIKTIKWPISGYQRRCFYNWQVERWVKKHQPDLIIGHGDIFKQDLCYIHNCVHLAHQRIHGKKIADNHQVAMIHERILQGQKFKVLVCNSKMMQEDLTKRFSIPIEKTTVIYPEVDLSKFNLKNYEENRAEMRNKLHIKSDEFLMGMITSGNFKKRNVPLIVNTLKELIDSGRTNIKLLIAGKNNDPSFQKQIDELGLSSYVIMAPSIKDVEKYYHAIDLFLLPALIEEFGRSVLEAMSSRLPVIVSSNVGSSEIITFKREQVILTELTTEELFAKIISLVDQQKLLSEMKEQNYKDALNYSAEKQNDKLLSLLKKLEII